MHYHIILTELCNSQCKYCYEKSYKEFNNELEKKFKFDFSTPPSLNFDLKKLKAFLFKDKEPVLIFYGGEPLLEINKIKQIIDSLRDTNVKFRMQTNAKLLNKLGTDYLNKIDKILVSIDGTEKRTDFNKGQGTYALVTDNIKKAREQGYPGEIIARMTVSEFPDICEQAISLLETNLFDSIHWQIDAGFYKFDFNKEKFEEFAEQYNKSISKLLDFWLAELRKGKVLILYPFIGIINRLLGWDKDSGIMCGAGNFSYAIATNGKIVACPITNSIENFAAGNLSTNPADLKKFQLKSKKCQACDEKNICGGRCLYWQEAGLWPEEGNKLICSTIKHLIVELRKILPEIQDLTKKQIIKQSDFNYEKYFGPEIIP